MEGNEGQPHLFCNERWEPIVRATIRVVSSSGRVRRPMVSSPAYPLRSSRLRGPPQPVLGPTVTSVETAPRDWAARGSARMLANTIPNANRGDSDRRDRDMMRGVESEMDRCGGPAVRRRTLEREIIHIVLEKFIDV